MNQKIIYLVSVSFICIRRIWSICVHIPAVRLSTEGRISKLFKQLIKIFGSRHFRGTEGQCLFICQNILKNEITSRINETETVFSNSFSIWSCWIFSYRKISMQLLFKKSFLFSLRKKLRSILIHHFTQIHESTNLKLRKEVSPFLSKSCFLTAYVPKQRHAN